MPEWFGTGLWHLFGESATFCPSNTTLHKSVLIISVDVVLKSGPEIWNLLYNLLSFSEWKSSKHILIPQLSLEIILIPHWGMENIERSLKPTRSGQEPRFLLSEPQLPKSLVSTKNGYFNGEKSIKNKNKTKQTKQSCRNMKNLCCNKSRVLSIKQDCAHSSVKLKKKQINVHNNQGWHWVRGKNQ